MTNPHKGRSREGWMSPRIAGPIPREDTAGHRRPDREHPSLAIRMDEAATLLHAVIPVRMGLTILGGFVASLILPRQVCVAWVAGGLALETWSWFATRAQARGKPIGPWARANFIANYAALNLCWLLLGALLWRTGTAEGMASGVVLILAIFSIFSLLFYAAPVMFLIAGAIPAIGTMTVIALTDGHSWHQLLPVWLMLGLATIFNLGRALGTPSAQQQQHWLSESLNSYEVLAENITDVITRVDLGGTCEYASPASLTALGYRPDELVGTNLVRLLDPESETAIADVFARLSADTTQPGVLTTRARHRDGHWLWLQTSLKMICADGTPIGLIGVSRDVSEQMAADIALRQARDDVAAARDVAIEASRAKTNFLANMSHELRTPLNAVLGFAELLSLDSFADRRREYAELIHGSGAHLLGLVDDLLDLSRIEAGKLELRNESIFMDALIAECLTSVDARARAGGLTLVTGIEPRLPRVFADRRALKQILLNLLTNAIKFTAEGGVVETFARLDPSGEFCFGVRDTGVGIAEKDQQRVFERFGQSRHDVASAEMGTGLGLPIVRGLVEAHGGRVTLESRPAHGTCVTVRLPSQCVPRAMRVVA